MVIEKYLCKFKYMINNCTQNDNRDFFEKISLAVHKHINKKANTFLVSVVVRKKQI